LLRGQFVTPSIRQQCRDFEKFGVPKTAKICNFFSFRNIQYNQLLEAQEQGFRALLFALLFSLPDVVSLPRRDPAFPVHVRSPAPGNRSTWQRKSPRAIALNRIAQRKLERCSNLRRIRRANPFAGQAVRDRSEKFGGLRIDEVLQMLL
jgi:hypothetical protein